MASCHGRGGGGGTGGGGGGLEEQRPGIPGKTLVLLAALLLGDTQAPGDRLTCFMQAY